jgi:hypothetical protein
MFNRFHDCVSQKQRKVQACKASGFNLLFEVFKMVFATSSGLSLLSLFQGPE